VGGELKTTEKSERYVMVPDSILASNLSPSAKLVYGLILSVGNKYGFKLTNKEIGKRCNISARRVSDIITELEQYPAIVAEYCKGSRVLRATQETAIPLAGNCAPTTQDSARPSKERLKKDLDTPREAALETWEQCFEVAAETYRELLKREPGWLHRDTLPLMELCSNPSITVADFEDRWVSFLQSTEPFTRKMRGNLKFFCEHFSEYAEGPKIPTPPPKTFDQLINEGTDNALRNIAREATQPKGAIQGAPSPDGRRNGERVLKGNARLLGPGATDSRRLSDPKPGPNAKPSPIAEEPPSAEDYAEFDRQLKRLAKVRGM